MPVKGQGLPIPEGVGARKVMRVSSHCLRRCLLAQRARLDLATMPSLRRDSAHNAQQDDKPIGQRLVSASSARQARMAQRSVPYLPHRASHASQEHTLQRQDPVSVLNVPPAVPALGTKLPSIHLVHLAGTTAFRVRPSVWRVLMANMALIMDPPYV